jgi:tetratricopeptide (TPR) repeat protein
MAQATRLNRTPELIEKGKVHLKEADAQIKKGRYAEALKEVRLAQGCDPLNPYVDALEYRIKGLIEKQEAQTRAALAGAVPPAEPIAELLSRARTLSAEGKMDEAWACAAHATLASPDDTGVVSLRSDLYATELVTRMVSPDEEIAGCLTDAERCIEEGDMTGAMENALRAFLLDPMHQAVAAFESRHAGTFSALTEGLGLAPDPSAA